MKKIFFSAFIILSAFISCNKFEDGPAFSLHTKNHRVANEWYLDQVFEDGVDKTLDYAGIYVHYRMILKRDNSYNLSYRYAGSIDYNEDGTWLWNKEKTDIIFTKNNSSTTTDWKVLRLKEKEWWIEYIDENSNPAKTIDFHFVR
ncbi:MAG: copper resistance protein NlpE N-terminal domain-containing protein [Bacteroidetes bacterium]|nr:copper resistance protein NlpE N-terminal domain-containing protein [Bacteroidota bacterium]